MNYIVITDIFGNRLIKGKENNNIPFIILHSVQPHLIIERVKSDIRYNNDILLNGSIWKLILPMIMHVLYNYRLDSMNYSSLGNMWFPDHDMPEKISIILANTNRNISQYPIDYENVCENNGVFIWKPICRPDYEAIGYIAARKKPLLREMKVINKNLLMDYHGPGENINNLTNMNEFNLLSCVGKNKITIKRRKLLNYNHILKLHSKNKYLTVNDNEIKLDKNSRINYTVQGELKINNKCIGVSMDDNVTDDFVYLQKCHDSDGQKWFPYRNNSEVHPFKSKGFEDKPRNKYEHKYESFISEATPQKSFISEVLPLDHSCLTSDNNDSVKVKEYNNNVSRKWRKDTSKRVSKGKSIPKWKTRSGRNVVLIEPDTPWFAKRAGYKNKLKAAPQLSKKELNKVSYRNNSDFMMNVQNPDTGYGYSYEQRQDNPYMCLDDCENTSSNEKTIEHFNHNDSNSKYNFHIIACALISLVFILVCIRLYYNSRKNVK